MSCYTFTQQEYETASKSWGCNCGPTALAFALRVSLEAARDAIPGFIEKRYTSPTMMKAGLETLGWTYRAVMGPCRAEMCAQAPALVRIQFTGEWTRPGANPRWAYGYTHWIATWLARDGGGAGPMVFDCNGGARTLGSWEREIVPLLATHPRGDGGWTPTHIWRLEAKAKRRL